MPVSRVTAIVAVVLAALLAAGTAAPADPGSTAQPVSLARVIVGDRVGELSGFDLTESCRDDWCDVVLWPGDAERLREAGFAWRTLVPDLAARDLADRRAEQAAQAANPGARMMYRTLDDYVGDMIELWRARPDIVHMYRLPHRTFEGRDVYALEIGGPDIRRARTDGRPTTMVVGLHHAREWPAAEIPMDFAQDLVNAYAAGDPSIVALLDAARVIVIPVTNPDGFVRSRETISDFLVPAPGFTAFFSEFAYHRKNLRPLENGFLVPFGEGVDPNRNYPFHWHGDGADDNPGSQTYHGPEPGSEPEVKNILEVMRTNHVLTMVTFHTYGNLVLRAWGDTWEDAPDEAAMAQLGDAMAAINGYDSLKGIGLYPTSGTTDDWHYGVTGGFGYTFEVGDPGVFFGLGNLTPAEGAGFHPQYNLHYPQLYAENRDALVLLAQAARDEAWHTVIEGTAPPGTVITTRKHVEVLNFDLVFGLDDLIPDVLEDSIVVGPSGTFAWHVNPSPAPDTIRRVDAGEADPADLESYVITARHPNGATRTTTIFAERGARYTIDLS